MRGVSYYTGHQCPAAAVCWLWSPWAPAPLITSQRHNPSPSPWTLDRGEQLDTCLLFIPSYLSSLFIVCVPAMTMTRLPIADIAMLPIYVSTVGGVTAPVFALAKCTSRRTWVSYTKTVMPPPLPGLPGLGPTFSQCHWSDQKLHLAFQFTIKWPLQDLSLTPIEGDVTKYPEAVQWGIKHFKQEFIQKSRITSCKLETFSPFSHW